VTVNNINENDKITDYLGIFFWFGLEREGGTEEEGRGTQE
jgi:hypothetical protein